MFAYRIIYLFFKISIEKIVPYIRILFLKFWINLLRHLNADMHLLHFTDYTVCTYFVVLSTIRSIAFFDSNTVCNYHVGWCDITIQFAAFTLYILPPILLWYGSIAFFWFHYSLQLSHGLMWYHVNPHFCYYVIVFIIKKCYNFFCIF